MMKLKINSFADVGVIDDERVVLKALSDLEIGEYAVFSSKLSEDGKATSGKKTAYWFPDGFVKKDDLVVIYTKKGKLSTKDLSDGRTAHFFYWGMDVAQWANKNNTIIVLHVSEWAKGLRN